VITGFAGAASRGAGLVRAACNAVSEAVGGCISFAGVIVNVTGFA